MSGNIGWTIGVVYWFKEERVFQVWTHVQWSLVLVEDIRDHALMN